MTLQDRVESYNAAFPKFPKIFFDKGWILGVWNIGNSYKGSGYFGSYPPSYLKRIMSMFPDKKNILHLFSGSLGPDENGITFDLNPETKPMVVGDAHHLSQFFNRGFDLILADPPYGARFAVKYGFPMINRFAVVKECVKVMRKGAHLVWMDQKLPMYRKADLARQGEIMITRSTNHDVRAVFIFEKK